MFKNIACRLWKRSHEKYAQFCLEIIKESSGAKKHSWVSNMFGWWACCITGDTGSTLQFSHFLAVASAFLWLNKWASLYGQCLVGNSRIILIWRLIFNNIDFICSFDRGLRQTTIFSPTKWSIRCHSRWPLVESSQPIYLLVSRSSSQPVCAKCWTECNFQAFRMN